MIFSELALPGAYAVEIEARSDDRGYFARLWCADEFAAAGLPTDFPQASVSHNRHAGTLRGLHFAWPPAQEGKLVRCGRGALVDVLLDLRPGSPTYLRHLAVELRADQYKALYIPPGIAHGFQTLADDTDVVYQMTERYLPRFADGVRHDDLAFGIRWPRPVSMIAERDRGYAAFDDAAFRRRHAQALGAGGEQ